MFFVSIKDQKNSDFLGDLSILLYRLLCTTKTMSNLKNDDINAKDIWIKHT